MSTLLSGSAHRRPVLRAVALAASGLGTLATTACGAAGDPSGTGADFSPPAGGTDVAAGTDADDALLLRAALAATDRALADLRAATRRHPALAARLAPALSVHTAHRDVLADARVSEPTAPPAAASGALPSTGGPDEAMSLLAAREAATGARLADLAVRARSGAFARVLASASAAVAAVAAGLSGPARAPAPAPLPVPVPQPVDAPLDGAATAASALQDALAAEHAAVWTVAVLGARTSRSAQPVLAEALATAYAAHRARRDILAAVLDGLGEQPVVAAATYELPRASSAGAVRRAAAGIEGACAGWYAALVAESVGSARELAVACLSDTAIRGLAFRGSPEIFPGLDEFADR